MLADWARSLQSPDVEDPKSSAYRRIETLGQLLLRGMRLKVCSCCAWKAGDLGPAKRLPCTWRALAALAASLNIGPQDQLLSANHACVTPRLACCLGAAACQSRHSPCARQAQDNSLWAHGLRNTKSTTSAESTGGSAPDPVRIDQQAVLRALQLTPQQERAILGGRLGLLWLSVCGVCRQDSMVAWA